MTITPEAQRQLDALRKAEGIGTRFSLRYEVVDGDLVANADDQERIGAALIEAYAIEASRPPGGAESGLRAFADEGSAILAWLATTLAMMCVIARLSWTASGLFAGAAIASLVFTMLLSRAAS